MSDHNTSPKFGARNYSTASSPTDSRIQPRRFEPIIHDQDDREGDQESTRAPGTIRRNRPAAISTSRVDEHGMFPLRSQHMLLTVSKARWNLTILRKNPPLSVNRRLYKMKVAKIYRDLNLQRACKCFLLNRYHQQASRRWRDEHHQNTTLPIKVRVSQ